MKTKLLVLLLVLLHNMGSSLGAQNNKEVHSFHLAGQ